MKPKSKTLYRILNGSGSAYRGRNQMKNLYRGQAFFYFLDKMGAGQCTLLTGSVIIPRRIPVAELQAAANELVRINNQLRVRFVEKDGAVYQEIKPFERKEFEVMRFESREALHEWCEGYGTIPLVLDWRTEGTGIPESAWKPSKTSPVLVKNMLIHKAKMRKLIRKYGMTDREPGVFELILFELPDGCGAIIKMHHIVSDAWTMLLGANQFLKILNGEKPLAYDRVGDANDLDEYKTTKRYQSDVEFFAEQQRKCPEKTWLWPESVSTMEGRRSTRTLTEELTEQIKAYSDEHGISPYVLFLTAAAVYMSRKLDRDMFYFGALTANRYGIREKNTVGMFVKQFPLLLELDQDESFAEAAARIKNRSFAGYKHQKGYVAPADSTALMYDLWVSYQTAVLSADTSAVVTQYYSKSALDIAIFSIEDRSGEGTFKLHFDHNLKVPEKDAEELFDTVIEVLSGGIADDSRSIGSFRR